MSVKILNLIRSTGKLCSAISTTDTLSIASETTPQKKMTNMKKNLILFSFNPFIWRWFMKNSRKRTLMKEISFRQSWTKARTIWLSKCTITIEQLCRPFMSPSGRRRAPTPQLPIPLANPLMNWLKRNSMAENYKNPQRPGMKSISMITLEKHLKNHLHHRLTKLMKMKKRKEMNFHKWKKIPSILLLIN